MTFTDMFHQSLVVVEEGTLSRDEVLSRISGLVAAETPEHPAEEIRKALVAREQTRSTGFEHGLALPHCSMPDFKSFFVGAVLVRGGVEFGALDGKKSHLFVFVIGPAQDRNRHVQLLAALSRYFIQPGALDKLLASEDAAALFRRIAHGVEFEDGERGGSFSCVRIHLQRQEVFETLLELVSGEAESSFSVYETKSASSFLHRMPLFATFWNPEDTTTVKIIEVVLPQERTNNLIRTVKEQLEINGISDGYLITAHELSYIDGGLGL